MKPLTEHLVSVRNSLAMILVTLVLVTGCGGPSPSQPDFQPSTQRPTNPTDTAVPIITDEPAKPRIDVVIDRIESPPRVNRSARLSLTIMVRNTSTSGLAAGITSVEIRARSDDPVNATDLALGSASFWDLQPNVAQEKSVSVTAPNRPGRWTMYATLDPVDYEDPVNNRLEARLVVD